MTEARKRKLDTWLVRVSLAAGIVNSIATAAAPVLDASGYWTTVFGMSGCLALLIVVAAQRHSLRRHQPLLNEKNVAIQDLAMRLDAANGTIGGQCRQLDEQATALREFAFLQDRLRRLRAALPIVLEANTELRQYVSPVAVRSCLKGDVKDFVSHGAAQLLTALRNGLRALARQNGNDEITCALHIGHGRISSVHAAGTPAHRKAIERHYVRSSHSLAGLVREYPTPLFGDSLEDRPPSHNGETHSAAGWSGNIHASIQSYICLPIVTHDGKEEKAIGVLQVDSPQRCAFPSDANVLVEAVADGIGILFQLGALADELEKQDDPLLAMVRRLPA